MKNRLNGNGESEPRYTSERINGLFNGKYSISKVESPLVHWVYERINWVDDWTTCNALRALLGFIVTRDWRVEDVEAEADRLFRGLDRLYGHSARQQQEINRLERQVENLQTRIARIEDRHVQEAAEEAVEAMENGEDMETVFEMLGRPEPLNEEVES